MVYLLSQMLSARARAVPSQTAIVAQEASVTYGELEERSHRLAGAFARRGIGHHDRIALCLPKGPAAYVSVFAILNAGSCYIPLDVLAPLNRIRYTLEDSSVSALVLDAALL